MEENEQYVQVTFGYVQEHILARGFSHPMERSIRYPATATLPPLFAVQRSPAGLWLEKAGLQLSRRRSISTLRERCFAWHFRAVLGCYVISSPPPRLLPISH